MTEFTEFELRSEPAEKALIGCLGFHGTEMRHIMEAVSPEDFYRPAREDVWRAARKLVSAGEPVDPVAIMRLLHADGHLNHAIEQLVAVEMTTSCPVEIAGRYSETVVELAKKREQYRAFQRAFEIITTHPGSASETLALARSELDKLVTRDDDPSTLNWRQLVDEFENTHAPGGASEGVPTPWWELDMLLGGLFGSRMYIIGGRPGQGKSTVALLWAMHAAKESGQQVLIFSKEMPSVDVTGRLFAAAVEVSLNEIAARRLSPESKRRIRDWTNKVGNLPIRVNAKPCSLSQIKNQARAQATRTGLNMLVVDYLQLVRADSGRNREQEVGQVSRELKELAMELDTILVVPAQLNRGSVTRTDPKPTMSDLRDSGQIEQDADAVILLYRPLDEQGQPTRGIDLLVDKNRHGPTGSVHLDWRGEYGMIQ
jgi:replicative DNA helicase